MRKCVLCFVVSFLYMYVKTDMLSFTKIRKVQLWKYWPVCLAQVLILGLQNLNNYQTNPCQLLPSKVQQDTSSVSSFSWALLAPVIGAKPGVWAWGVEVWLLNNGERFTIRWLIWHQVWVTKSQQKSRNCTADRWKVRFWKSIYKKKRHWLQLSQFWTSWPQCVFLFCIIFPI